MPLRHFLAILDRPLLRVLAVPDHSPAILTEFLPGLRPVRDRERPDLMVRLVLVLQLDRLLLPDRYAEVIISLRQAQVRLPIGPRPYPQGRDGHKSL